MSEIYGRPIEIYSYSNKPMRTFHEQCDSGVDPIRLSYHGKSHYNAVVPIGWKQHNCYETEPPGEIENRALSMHHAHNDKPQIDKELPK